MSNDQDWPGPNKADSSAPDISVSEPMRFGRNENIAGVQAIPKAVSPSKALEPEKAAPAPKRSRHARNRFVVFFNLLMSTAVFGTLVVVAIAYFGKVAFQASGPLEASRTIVVKEGHSLATIANQLEARGIIESDLVFRLGVRAYNSQSKMQAGEYAFNPKMSMFDVMETLRSGNGIAHKVSIPEGLTTFQILERVAKNDILVGEMPTKAPAEGSLMPDTYPFQRGLTRIELISEMARAQKIFLQKVWDRRVPGLPISTPEEMVILASIVEKETGKADERPHVASVFVNRLNKGIKLQSDPTIIYGIFGGKGKPKGRPIYRSDLKKVTGYNTYIIDALPPGPISNPGRASLEAVANPSNTQDLFFVADGTGGHVFAASLAEHNANVTRWRAVEKRMKQEAEKKKKEAAARKLAEDAAENSDENPQSN